MIYLSRFNGSDANAVCNKHWILKVFQNKDYSWILTVDPHICLHFLHFAQQFHIISCKIKCYLATIISNSTGHDTQKFDASTHIHALTYLQASTYLHASTLQAQMYCLTECNSSPTLLSLLSPPLHTAQGRMSGCRASPRNIHIVDTTSFYDNFVSTLMSSKINNVKFRYSIMCKQDEAFKVPCFPFCTPHI